MPPAGLSQRSSPVWSVAASPTGLAAAAERYEWEIGETSEHPAVWHLLAEFGAVPVEVFGDGVVEVEHAGSYLLQHQHRRELLGHGVDLEARVRGVGDGPGPVGHAAGSAGRRWIWPVWLCTSISQ